MTVKLLSSCLLLEYVFSFFFFIVVSSIGYIAESGESLLNSQLSTVVQARMRGEKASLGSLSEALNFEHGSTSSNNAVIDQQICWENMQNLGNHELHDYMISATDTNTTFSNFVYREQRDLHRFSLGEASSSGTKNIAAAHSEQWMEIGRLEERRKDKLELNLLFEDASHSEKWMEVGRFEEHRNDKLELNPLFEQPSSGNHPVRNVNLNAEYNEHHEDMNPITGHPCLFEVNGLRSGLLSENSGRAIDGRRASCKRKAIDASIGQSSSSGGFHEFQHGESNSRVSASSFYSSANGLNISLDHGSRRFVSGTVPNQSALAIPESSSRHYSVRVNPTNQQDTVSPSVFAAGSVIRRPVGPPLTSPPDQQLIDLRYGHALGNSASQDPNASRIRLPHVSRNMIPLFQWSGSVSSATHVDRSIIHLDQTSQRSNNLEIPLFDPAPQLRNLPHSHISSQNASGHGSSSSSRTTVEPSPANLAWARYQNNSSHNQRRLSEHFRWSLLSSIAANQRAARSMVPPASPDEQLVQPGGGNTIHVQNRAYSRAGPRLAQNAIRIPHSLRGLASTSRGRTRMGASEIRNVLDHMRRGGNLRFEDVMLLNQSMGLGVADIHDRYRDMRLDVDNMTYEELLSLEERIGDVCTGLNEETISNRLKQQKYKSSTGAPQEVEPCCICQEEYKEGEEMGLLECGHEFHSQCIKEWLVRKNLCPICKTTGLNTAEKPRR